MKPEDFGLPADREHDIGEGVTITLVTYKGEPVGLNEAHQDDSGRPCFGFVLFEGASYGTEPGAPSWKVESANPLTLSPSILCRSCGHHGFIRNGRWVSA